MQKADEVVEVQLCMSGTMLVQHRASVTSINQHQWDVSYLSPLYGVMEHIIFRIKTK